MQTPQGWSDVQFIALLFFMILPFAIFFKSYYNAMMLEIEQPVIKDQNILYIIAHPDDEAMFFVPSIRKLSQKNKLYLLCLGNGDAEGLGRIREKELIESAKFLGFAEQPTIINEPDLPDSMQVKWPQAVVSKSIARYLRSSTVAMNIIITFDEQGVSSHPNHIGVYEGCCDIFQKNEFGINKLWTLETVNIVRKYISYWDLQFIMPGVHVCAAFNPFFNFRCLALHQSQFVWFRKLFLFFSRYTFVNTFKVFLIKEKEAGLSAKDVVNYSDLK